MENQMTKLAVLLAKADIPFELNVIERIPDCPSSVQIISPSKKNWKVDAVCHTNSYGGKDGLLEVWADEPVIPNSYVGWLKAEEAFEYFVKANQYL